MTTFKNSLDDALGEAIGKRPKRNNTPGASKANRPGRGAAGLHKAARIASRTPEVMVKVSGGARGARHTREHINYITRNGKLVAETSSGEKLDGKEVVRDFAASWSEGDKGKRRNGEQRNSRDTVNLVLSMPPGTNRDRLQDAVRAFAAKNFAADREYLFVRHDDTKHPHCHLTLKAVGYDGKRLNPRKNDLQAWREAFALSLREAGVAAEASPRHARGVTKKAKRQAIVHTEQRGTSTVAKAKVDDAIKRVVANDTRLKPWEQAIAERQTAVRGAWRRAAAVLDAEGGSEGRKLASTIHDFVKSMPPVETEQQAIVRELERRAGRAVKPEKTRDEPERGR